MKLKQITVLTFAIILCIICLPLSCFADEGGTAGVLSWSIDDAGNFVLSGSGTMPDYEPGQTPWKDYAATIKNVTICAGVKNIGNYAFFQCTALKDLSLPDGLESIGTYAFGYCTSLKSISFPVSFHSLGAGALSYCTNLREVRFSGEAPVMGERCFLDIQSIVHADCQKTGWQETSQSMYGGKLIWDIHILDYNYSIIEKAPDCTNSGKLKVSCIACGAVVYENIEPLGHSLEHFEKCDADCNTAGTIEYWHCTKCDTCYSDKKCTRNVSEGEITIPAGHDIITEPGLEPTAEAEGYTEKSYCKRCGEVLKDRTAIPALGYTCKFDELSPGTEININGINYVVDGKNEVKLPNNNCEIATSCVYSGVITADGNGRYPAWLRVYIMCCDENGSYNAVRCTEMDNLLGYCGMSVKINGNKGIRITSSVPDYAKVCLAGDGLMGFKLIEYGTLAAAKESVPSTGLTADTPGVSVLPAYIKGGMDEISGAGGGKNFFIGEILGLSNEQYSTVFVLRPYMKLSTPKGQIVTVYGGSISRSPGYVALQNKSEYAPGTDRYKYIWSLIHLCYGDAYDAEYIP